LIFEVGRAIVYGNFEGNVATLGKSGEILMRDFLTGSVNFDRAERTCRQNTDGSKQQCVRYIAFQL
jgi:hypothetical protein